MAQFTFESVTKTSFRVNGGLIDLVAISYHLDTHAWGPHNPKMSAATVRGWLMIAEYDIEYRSDPAKQQTFLHFLANLYNYGLPVPKQAFSVCPGKHPYALWSNPKGPYRKTFISSTGYIGNDRTTALEVWDCTESQ